MAQTCVGASGPSAAATIAAYYKPTLTRMFPATMCRPYASSNAMRFIVSIVISIRGANTLANTPRSRISA